MLWLIFSIMLLAALLSVAWPLYRQRRVLIAGISAIVVLAASVGLYARLGTPDAEVQMSAGLPDIGDMVASLEARLASEQGDIEGWKMLGRSHMQLGNLDRAIAAFEKAIELENGENGETLISLGEVLLSQDRSTIEGRAGQLFESGLALSPNSPRGLFYGGFSALQRDDRTLAADRWEALLALSPPPEIQGILEQRVAEWRGEESAVDPVTGAEEPIVTVSVSAADASILAGNATVFVIARDPAQPSPPLAVVRRDSSDFPGAVEIFDDNAMIAGREPSNYEQLEIVVRVSRSGQPIAQPGDWFGQAMFSRGSVVPVEITIDRQVP